MQPLTQSSKQPVIFDDFFDMGLPEEASPFLNPSSRQWGINLTLKASLLAAFLLFLAFIFTFFPQTASLSHLLLLIVYFCAGVPALIESIEDLMNFEINIDILMTLAAFSSILIGSGMEGGLLLVLFALSGAMEDAATTKAKSSLNQLHKLSPAKACVIDSKGMIFERSVKDVATGNFILVKSGQIVPLDGLVTEGISSVNLVHLTGESHPVTKKVGDHVPAGARNQEGSLTLQVTHSNSDSTLARIIQLITQAQEAKPRLQRLFDNFSNRYAMTIILTALFFAFTLPFIIQIPFLGTKGSLYRALAFLIAASPCALIIAIPIAYLSAMSACANKGILIKGGISLDALAKCSTFAFDKTGTLTLGDLTCVAIEPLTLVNRDTQQILAVAYALEKNAVHPIAKAITTMAENKNVENIKLIDFKAIPGYGLEAKVLLPEGLVTASIGHAEYIASILPKDLAHTLLTQAKEKQNQGELIAVLLIGTDIFLFRFVDQSRPKIKESLVALKRKGWRLIMLTGDCEILAQKIALEMGIDEVFANLRPQDKLDHVDKISKKSGLVMIGDGINDAPALARATVGICMGKIGSSTAIDAADIVLLHDNIELIDWLMTKSRQTQRIVKQNLGIALGAIAVAALPALLGLVPLWLAVVMHEGGTILVGLNALRLLKQT
jgi:heavy metal translocating P-type ATPase